MSPIRLAICATTLVLLSAASAATEPAYVPSTVNLRSGAGTSNEIVAKIPGGSLVDASSCSEWCEVEWQGKKGFAIAAALDRSGRVRAQRGAPRQAAPAAGAPAVGAYVEDDVVPIGPPLVYGAPYYYGYRPYYWGYGYRRGYGYGYRRGYRRW